MAKGRNIGTLTTALTVRLLERIVTLMPLSWAMKVGAAFGWVSAWTWSPRCRVADENLAHAFPEKTPHERRRIRRRFYTHMGRWIVTTLTLSRITKTNRKITVIDENRERLDALLNSGKGFIAVTGHMGHWEIMVVDFAFRGVPLSAVVKPLHNRHLNDHIVRTRSASGLKIIFTSKQAQREVIKRLNDGEVVVFVADQDARQFGTFVDFFGRPASTHRGPAMFALRTGLPMLPVFTYWERGVIHRAIYGEPIYPPENPPDKDLAIQEMTQAFTRQLEALARRVPEQYFWVHRRWKTQPEMLKAKRHRRAGIVDSEAD